jgi:glycosyltransferase involved in cell wall biosynthesis
MRVLIVHNRYRSAQPSGENSVVDEDLRLLQEAGVDVRLLQVQSDDIASWPRRRRALVPLQVIWSRDGARRTVAAIADAQPDVVHFHNTFPLLSSSALRAAHRSGALVIQTLHNFRYLCPAGTLYRDGHVCHDCLRRTPWPAVLHGCYRDSTVATIPVATMDAVHSAARGWRWVDTYIAPSRFARDRYVEAGWPADRFTVKYNTAPDRGQPREGAGEGFVCLARLTPEKGVDVLLAAWRLAFPHGEQELVIAGSGALEPQLRADAAGLEGVRFAGQLGLAEAMDLVRGARALVVPSVWYELFPRTIAEAYAMGVPVVASRLGSLAEIVRDRRTGLLFDPGDPDSLASALRELAGDPALCKRLGSGAHRAYRMALSPAASVARLLEIYGGPARPTALEEA